MKRKPHEIGFLGRLSVRLSVAAVLVLVGLIVCSLYLFFPQHREELKFITAAIVGLTAIYSAYYVGASIRQRIGFDKMDSSFMFLKRFNDIDLFKTRIKIQELIDSKSLPSADIAESIKSDPDLQIAVKSTLNLFENISIAIQYGYADEKIFYRDLSVVIPWLMKNMDPYISTLRANYEDDSIYCESIKLSGAWTSGKYLLSGKSIEIIQ